MYNKIRCVILGLGNQAREHIAASIEHPELEIIAGIDENTDQWRQVKLLFPELDLQFFKSLDDLKASKLSFDGLILALPHHAYQKLWNQITSYHLPLLKEKPLGRNYHEARMFMQTARQYNCGLMTAIQRREHPSYQFLAQYLTDHKITVSEIYAHLHLGKGKVIEHQQSDLGWRSNKIKAGGGALLDAGYHLIDLIQFLTGEFDVVSATMWNGQKADNGLDIEDRSWVMGRSNSAWIMLDTWVKGHEDGKGGFFKFEQVVLQCNQGILKASREGVWLNEKQLYHTDRGWNIAMRKQLSHFARNIRSNDWSGNLIWDQLPAMRKIEEAYKLSAQY